MIRCCSGLTAWPLSFKVVSPLSLRESCFGTLEVRVKDGFGDKDAEIEQHRLHQMGDSGEARQQLNSSQ